MDYITLLKQQLNKVAAVLTGDTGNQSSFIGGSGGRKGISIQNIV